MEGKIIEVADSRAYATVQYGEGKISALIEDGIRQFARPGLPVLFSIEGNRVSIYWVGDNTESPYPQEAEIERHSRKIVSPGIPIVIDCKS